MHTLVQDVQHALRQLRRSPGFAVTAALTLTMAIAANIIVFGVVNALLLNDLPVREPQQIFQIQQQSAMDITMSLPDLVSLRERNNSFSDLAAARYERVGIEAEETARAVWAYEVSGDYFSMLGVRPALGRYITDADDQNVNGSQVIVLSYACWKVRYAADPQIVGKTIKVNKVPFTVIGVAGESFRGTEKFLWPEVWVPIHDAPEIEGYNWLADRGNHNLWIIGRLRVGVTQEQASADVQDIASQLGREYPDNDKGVALRLVKPGFLGDALNGPVHGFLFGVMLLAGLVLVAACANLGGLFSARTADRAKEFGIRIAIGSSRARIMRQLMTESIVISLFSGLAAALMAASLLHALTLWHPQSEIPIQFLVEPGILVYLFSALLAVVTGVVFGAIPARQVWQADPNQTMKATGAGTGERRRFPVRDVLLAVQIALCGLLVSASFVSLRGLLQTVHMHFGFQPEGVTLASIDTNLGGYKSYEDAAQIEKKLLDAVSQIPGVTSAAYASSLPLSVNQSSNGFFAPGTTLFDNSTVKFLATYYDVSPDYFTASGTRILSGRAFTEHDNKQSPEVAIVNQTFARRLFGTEQAVGLYYPTSPGHQTLVVGVVEDGKYTVVTEEPKPAIFWPSGQSHDHDTVLVVRSNRDSTEMVAAVRQAISEVDGGLPTFLRDSWPNALKLVTFPARLATIALGVLGALAVMLAVTGIFGLASYTVAKRMRELGIRVALGASHRRILQAALQRTTVLLAAGSVAGLGLGAAAGKVLSHIVFGARATDPLTLMGVVLTMAAIGIFSAAVPAGRALSADPARLLRDE